MIKNILLIATLLLATTAHADIIVTPEAVPENLHIYSESGRTFVRLVAKGCSGITYNIPADHVQFDAIFSMILSAQISGKPIRLRFDGCNANSQGIVVGAYLP